MWASDPWQNFAPADKAGDLRVRRVDDAHPHGFWWGRDAQGHYLLVLKSEEELAQPKETPRVRGVSLELTMHQFAIRLMQSSEVELFTTLCWSLVERTRSAKSNAEVLTTLISQLERWQRFLGRSNLGLLSEQEVRGLFSELEFLGTQLLSRFGAEAVRFWRGPLREPQDFAAGDTAFEIKSHVVGSQPVAVISSVHQLVNPAGDLYMIVYAIGEAASKTPGARSLLQQVEAIRTALASSALVDVFDDLLREVGYIDHPEYGRQVFSVVGPTSYLVTEGFPRITPDLIPQGVCRLQYGIELAACESFRVEGPDWAKLGVLNGG